MKVMESDAARNLTNLYQLGAHHNWLGVAGDSVSRWLTPRELMAMETELDLNSTDFVPLNVKEPRLARECFMYCCHGDVLPGDYDGSETISLKILQVNGEGDRCRVLWESGEPNRPPLEISLHFTAHAAHSVGPGCVVYHCQPLNTLALAALLGEHEDDFMKELLQGYAAIDNMLPDGIGIIPWAMKKPLRRGEKMNREMYQTMEGFMSQIREHISHQEALVLRGEGIICASRSERSVYSIIHAIERAATIRLSMYAAGARC